MLRPPRRPRCTRPRFTWANAIPVSLSLPLREDSYRGAPATAVFGNLLPDSDALRRRVAERVGAEGSDAHSLLSAIGRDCVGALQFVAGDDEALDANAGIEGKAIDDSAIERLLRRLAQAPLGLSRDDDFRIFGGGRAGEDSPALGWQALAQAAGNHPHHAHLLAADRRVAERHRSLA